MKPTTVMVASFGMIVLGHWANGKPALSAKLLVEMGFATVVVAMLSEDESSYAVAAGFSWLFFAAVLLGSNSPLSGLTKAANSSTPKATGPAVQAV
jgi:O-antigen ligase